MEQSMMSGITSRNVVTVEDCVQEMTAAVRRWRKVAGASKKRDIVPNEDVELF